MFRYPVAPSRSNGSGDRGLCRLDLETTLSPTSQTKIKPLVDNPFAFTKSGEDGRCGRTSGKRCGGGENASVFSGSSSNTTQSLEAPGVVAASIISTNTTTTLESSLSSTKSMAAPKPKMGAQQIHDGQATAAASAASGFFFFSGSSSSSVPRIHSPR